VGATSTLWLYFSYCWRCIANGRSQNTLPFLHLKENTFCHGNSYKNCASLADNASFSLMHLFTWHKTTWLTIFSHGIKLHGLQSLSCWITCQTCQRSTVASSKTPTSRNLKWTFKDASPCYYYAIKTNSRPQACSRVSKFGGKIHFWGEIFLFLLYV